MDIENFKAFFWLCQKSPSQELNPCLAVKALSSNDWTASELPTNCFFDHREIMLPHITEYFAKWITSLVRKKEKAGQFKKHTYYQNQPEVYVFKLIRSLYF